MKHVILLATCGVLAFGQADLQKTLHGIENRYNNIKTLQVNFTETLTGRGGKHVPQSGVLYLRKPGRMRWEYTAPPGMLVVSDGESVYDYDPSGHKVETSKLKEVADPRSPLAFLLGKVDFDRDFGSYETGGPDGAITALPKSRDLGYQKIGFVVGPDFQIKKLSVTQIDGSVIDYTFENEIKNPSLADTLFKFTPPPGAVVVDLNHGAPQ